MSAAREARVAEELLRLIREEAVESFRVLGIEPTQEQILFVRVRTLAALIEKAIAVSRPEDRAELEALGLEIVRDAGFDMGPRN